MARTTPALVLHGAKDLRLVCYHTIPAEKDKPRKLLTE